MCSIYWFHKQNKKYTSPVLYAIRCVIDFPANNSNKKKI